MLARLTLSNFRGSTTASRRRRCNRIANLAQLALRGAGEGKSLVHVAWLFIFGLCALAIRAPELGWMLAPALGLLWALIVTTFFDAIYLIIPDLLLGVMLLCGAVYLTPMDSREALAQMAAGLCAFGFLRLVAFVYERWRGRPGLGAGDAKLFGVAGLWLGAAGLPSCLLAAVISSLISVAIERRVAGPIARDEALPFGPHLALGLWLTFVFGPFPLDVNY